MNIIKNVAFNSLLLFLIGAATAVNANDLTVALKDGVCMANIADKEYRCSLGRSGLSSDKTEGDGTTPIGKFPLRQLLVRADKISKKELQGISLPMHDIKQVDGWCDDPTSVDYNKLVTLKGFSAKLNHEKLHRTDGEYDLVIVVGYNDAPAVANKGSAIFIRIAGPNYAPTAGGIGFSRHDLLVILSKLAINSHLIVEESK